MTLTQREAKARWRKAGGRVKIRSGTGETRWTHPLLEKIYLVNNRRKDCPKVVLSALRKLEE